MRHAPTMPRSPRYVVRMIANPNARYDRERKRNFTEEPYDRERKRNFTEEQREVERIRDRERIRIFTEEQREARRVPGLRAFVLNTGGLHVFLCHHIRDDIVFVNVCASKYAARSESEASWTWFCKVLQEAGLSCYMRKGKIIFPAVYHFICLVCAAGGGNL
ncbi:hypothetical protein PPROV_000045100 [Pycnococcus provasolii]|uniref:Uncharacterized protein n=1 Tax=Pycnococcus provasolii TaxID=41880 RepID=A0A830H3U0_9CHLO|nr:hypothetical protein PPROV_000045100 [Pycnococcus provasolii]